MTKLIYGEVYRILHKKSMYIYFGALAVGYIFITFIRSGGFNDESAVKDAAALFSFFPALAGGFLFSSVFTDDLNSKNLITLVGFGINKIKIIIAKFIIAVLFGAVLFGILPLFHFALYAVFSSAASASQTAMLFALSFKFLLMTLAYCAISGIVVFGSQRTTFAIVTYILFSFSVIGTLITAAGNMLGLNLYSYLLPGVTDRILAGLVGGSSIILPIIQYSAYVLIAIILSALAFNKKEMEF